MVTRGDSQAPRQRQRGRWREGHPGAAVRALHSSTSTKRHQAWRDRLIKVANSQYRVKPDCRLHEMVPAEAEALVAWVIGMLLVASPPGFLVCTHPHPNRLAYTSLYAEHIERRVVAVVPPSVILPARTAETTVELKLLNEEAAGSEEHAAVVQMAPSRQQTGLHRRHTSNHLRCGRQSNGKSVAPLVTPTRSGGGEAAQHGPTREGRGPTRLIRATEDEGALLRYQVGVLGSGLDVEVVEQLIRGVGCEVTVLERLRARTTDAYNSNF